MSFYFLAKNIRNELKPSVEKDEDEKKSPELEDE